MRHVKLPLPWTLTRLREAFAGGGHAQRDFWLSQDGNYAQIEAEDGSLIAVQADGVQLKLSQHRGQAADFRAVTGWLAGLGNLHPPQVDETEDSDGIRQAADFYAHSAFLAQGWQALFPEAQRLNFEIGCGYGHFLAWLAPRHPHQAFIGVDIVSKVLRKAERRMRQAQAGNVVLAKLDALLTLEELVVPASLDHLYILFPDPWPKAVYRRSLRADTLGLFASRLKAGGRLIFVSDDPDYAADASALLEASPDFAAGPFPPIEVKTKYEQKWLAQEKSITRLAYTRLSRPELPDTGSWPGYEPEPLAVLAGWRPDWREQIATGFHQRVLQVGQTSLKLDACYRALHQSALRFKLILAPGGSTLAQHSWLELVDGKLRPAPGSWLPCLAQREAILERIAAELGALTR